MFREILLKFDLRICNKVPFLISLKRCYIFKKMYILYESATRYLWDFIVYTGIETLYPSPYVKLPIPFENFKNPSKVFCRYLLHFITCYNLASTIYTHCQSYFIHINKIALMRMVHYETSKPHI